MSGVELARSDGAAPAVVMELAAKLDHPEPFDWHTVIDAAERDFEWAELIQGRAKLRLHHLIDLADRIKQYRPNWQTARDDLAKLVRRIERLRLTQEPPVETTPSEMVKVIEAARRLGQMKSSGKPSDRFYSQTLPAIGTKHGGRWLIHEADLQTFMRGGRTP